MTDYIKSQKNYYRNCERGLTLISTLTVLAILTLGFFYLVQANSLVGASYEIRDYKEKAKELAEMNQELEMQIVKAQSPNNLEKAIENLGMVKVDKAIYLVNDQEVAVRN